jgi:hypothetical protein
MDPNSVLLLKNSYRSTHWTRMCLVFQKEGECRSLQNACCPLETVTMEIFTRHGFSDSESEFFLTLSESELDMSKMCVGTTGYEHP